PAEAPRLGPAPVVARVQVGLAAPVVAPVAGPVVSRVDAVARLHRDPEPDRDRGAPAPVREMRELEQAVREIQGELRVRLARPRGGEGVQGEEDESAEESARGHGAPPWRDGLAPRQGQAMCQESLTLKLA